ncbi:hypothetical protein NA57DRAFT_79690 [Rhizodiscina lignyota]|uniref:N-acetyltransferase domain-containing protein n=1 Tax=Rhizodiscina lignyota TaxID=1504668 RepID=A0A9P4M5D6_9PEZI|nr:hypothetical protein NA57DRAFT_79690 [Rhizodiscina lignyota]
MSSAQFPPLPLPRNNTISTARLILRPIQRSDLPAYYKLRGDAQVMKYSRAHQPDADEDATWLKMQPLLRPESGPYEARPPSAYGFGIELKPEVAESLGFVVEEETLVGDISCAKLVYADEKGEDKGEDQGEIVAEIGYMLLPELWGKGIITEAVSAFVQHWKELIEGWKRDVSSSAEERDPEETARLLQRCDIGLIAALEEPNTASYKVLVKCGFHEVRRWVNPGNWDRVITMALPM